MNDGNNTPSAELSDNPAASNNGSLERAVAGDYEFDIGQINREAWSLVKGNKWPVHLSVSLYALYYLVILLAARFGIYGLFGLDPMADFKGELAPYTSNMALASLLENILFFLLTAPVTAGLCMMALRLSVKVPSSATFIFGFFDKMLPLFFTHLLMYILIMLGFLLLILPGIYLSVAYLMAIPLLVEKNLSPWQALETSRKAISKRWFSVFGWYLVIILLSIAASIPLFLGWIWFLPMALISFGIIYRNMFGIEATTLNH